MATSSAGTSNRVASAARAVSAAARMSGETPRRISSSLFATGLGTSPRRSSAETSLRVSPAVNPSSNLFGSTGGDPTGPVGRRVYGRVMPFVPDDFVVPTELLGGWCRLRPLAVSDNERDFAAWHSSVDHINDAGLRRVGLACSRLLTRAQRRRPGRARGRLRRAPRVHLHGARRSQRRHDRLRLHLPDQTASGRRGLGALVGAGRPRRA